MGTAAAHLESFVATAPSTPPSITLSTSQRHTGPAGRWAPGIACYGWGLNGRVVDGIALRFGVMAWFSDRRTNPAASAPEWQQFSAKDQDDMLITLAPRGADVRATVVLLTWGNATFSSDSILFEDNSQQFVFVVPGAGPGAPPAVMTISLHPSGETNFL